MSDDWIKALLNRYRSETMTPDPVMEALLESRLRATAAQLEATIFAADTPETARMKALRATKPTEH